MPDRSTWSATQHDRTHEEATRLPLREIVRNIMVRHDRRDVWWAAPSPTEIAGSVEEWTPQTLTPRQPRPPALSQWERAPAAKR
jgi:hypothetical protein